MSASYPKSERLPEEEIQGLVARWQLDKDAKARDKIITSYTPLMLSVVNDRYSWFIGDRSDLYQEAMFGLMRAIDLYKPEHGTNFATYSRYWMTSRTSRWLDFHNGHSPRYRMVRFKREEIKQRLASGEPPSSIGKSMKMRAATLLRALDACEPMARLDHICADDGTPLIDMIASNDVPPDATNYGEHHYQLMHRAVDQLPLGFRRVIKYRMQGRTQDWIAKRTKMTRQGVSAIENRAMKALRAIVKREDMEAA